MYFFHIINIYIFLKWISFVYIYIYDVLLFIEV
jgi:hypothetical protein